MKKQLFLLILTLIGLHSIYCQINVSPSKLYGKWEMNSIIKKKDTLFLNNSDNTINKYKLLFVPYGDSLLFGLNRNDTLIYNGIVYYEPFGINYEPLFWKNITGRNINQKTDSINIFFQDSIVFYLQSDSILCFENINEPKLSYIYRYDGELKDSMYKCISTNPRIELDWLKPNFTQKSYISSNLCHMNQYFYVTLYPHAADGGCIVYNCYGERVCNLGIGGYDCDSAYLFLQEWDNLFDYKYIWVGINSGLENVEPTLDPINYPEMVEDTTTSNNILLKNNHNIYPNPTKKNISIRIPATKKNTQLDIYDIEGTCCKSVYLQEGNIHHINIKGLKNGIYICRIISGKVVLYKEKLLILK